MRADTLILPTDEKSILFVLQGGVGFVKAKVQKYEMSELQF